MCVAPSQQHGQQLAKQQIQQQHNRAEVLLEAFSYQDICNTYSIYKRISMEKLSDLRAQRVCCIWQ